MKFYATYPVHKWHLDGSHVFAIRMPHYTMSSDYTVSCGGVWLLQEREHFDIHTVGERKRIKIPKCCF